MAHYAIGKFEASRSGSPHQFVCLKLYPKGPIAFLDTRHLGIDAPNNEWHLFELNEWDRPNQRKQDVTRLVAPLSRIRSKLYEALRAADWEMVTERGRQQIRIVGRVLKTEYGYFTPKYRSGLNARGPGQDVDPWIVFEPYLFAEANAYSEAWSVVSEEVRGYLSCHDEAEVRRAHDAGIAKEDLGDLLREKLG